MQMAPKPDWSFALNYRAHSHVKIDNGDATFSQLFTGDPLFDGYVASQLSPKVHRRIDTVHLAQARQRVPRFETRRGLLLQPLQRCDRGTTSGFGSVS